MSGQYYVYILSNASRTLYVGVTNDLERRMWEHRHQPRCFAKRYHVTHFVYFEETDDISAAIRREKQIKGWTRARKTALIERRNPRWRNLAAHWYDSEVL